MTANFHRDVTEVDHAAAPCRTERVLELLPPQCAATADSIAAWLRPQESRCQIPKTSATGLGGHLVFLELRKDTRLGFRRHELVAHNEGHEARTMLRVQLDEAWLCRGLACTRTNSSDATARAEQWAERSDTTSRPASPCARTSTSSASRHSSSISATSKPSPSPTTRTVPVASTAVTANKNRPTRYRRMKRKSAALRCSFSTSNTNMSRNFCLVLFILPKSRHILVHMAREYDFNM